MDVDLLKLPLKVSIGLVLWTLALLTYRVLHAVIEAQKTPRPHAGPPCDDTARTKCVHRTGEYFLKSSEPCTCTGVISGVVTRISESDKFRLFHTDPGYSQLEDTLHVKLTGIEISQNRGTDDSKFKRVQTVVDVEDHSSSARTTPGENSLASHCCSVTLPNDIHGNPQNDTYFGERLPGFNAFSYKKIQSSEDMGIRVPNQTSTNQQVEDLPSKSSQTISIVSEVEPPIFSGNGFVLPIYGQLNKIPHQKLPAFEIFQKNRKNGTSSPKDPHLQDKDHNAGIYQLEEELPHFFSPTKTVTHEGKIPTSAINGFASVIPDAWYPQLKNILDERLHDNFWKNTTHRAKVIQNQTPGNKSPAIIPPAIRPTTPDANRIAPTGVDPECPLLDAVLHKAMAATQTLEGRLEDNLKNVSGQSAAYQSTKYLLETSNLTPRVSESTISYCNGSVLLQGDLADPQCLINVNEKLPHFDICQKIKADGVEYSPVQIHDQKTADQLEKFLQGTVSQTIGTNPMKSIILGSNGLVLPEASPRNLQFGKNLHWRQPRQIDKSPQRSQQYQSPSPECLQMKITEGNEITSFSEEIMIPSSNSDYQHDTCLKILPKDLGYPQTDIKINGRSSGNIMLQESNTYIPDDLPVTSDYDAVIVNAEPCPTTVTAISRRNSPIPRRLSHFKNDIDSCGETSITASTADGCGFMCGGELPDPLKLQTVSSDTKIVDWDGGPSSSKNTADGSDECDPEDLHNFSPDHKAIDCNAEALRRIIINRRISSSSSSSSSIIIWSTSEDGSFIFPQSSPDHKEFDWLVEDLPRIRATCLCTGKISGTVTHITDGDTIRLQHKCLGLSEVNETRVRLAGIDAPELPDQPFSEESKEHLKDLIYEKNVDLEIFDLDQYGRVLGMVYLPPLSENINLEMVRSGYACVYTGKGAAYGKHKEDFERLEKEAKSLKKGMWSQTDIVLPGEYKRQRSGK